jgi:hypothetical protein
MYFATKSRKTQILVWLIWAVACLVFCVWPEQALAANGSVPEWPALPGVVTHDARNGPLFPWHPRHRWRKWAWRRYCALRRAHRRVVWVARLARLLLTGVPTLAQLVDLVTQSQVRRHLGDLPVLYALLETLQMRDIVLAWVFERGSSWGLPVSIRWAPSQQTDVEVGIADAKYGNHRFLAPLKDEPCGVLVRMRRDRVLYGAPDAYSGRGRPRVHGERFAFKESQTWGEPDAMAELEHPRWGKVRPRRWDDKHARQDADTSFSVILIKAHLERERPSAPFWLGYQPPPHQKAEDQKLKDLWLWYEYRWPVEPSIRFRKQYLNWTLPRFQTAECCDRWTMLVSLAQWQLFLGRHLVKDKPLPWQPAQENPTLERVLQGFGGLFRQIGTPAAPPQTLCLFSLHMMRTRYSHVQTRYSNSFACCSWAGGSCRVLASENTQQHNYFLPRSLCEFP